MQALYLVAALLLSQVGTLHACLLPDGSDVDCGPQGSCMTNQRLGQLAFAYDTSTPSVLQQQVNVYPSASFCKCAQGYWGSKCENACPSSGRQACGGRHVQPLPQGSPVEQCGQTYHVVARDAERFNFSWAIPGTCQCTFPFLGTACDYKYEHNRVRPLEMEWTPTYQGLLDEVKYIKAAANGGPPFSLDSVCGSGVTLQSTGCACPIGVFPTLLRFDPALYAGAGVATGRFSMQNKIVPYVTAATCMYSFLFFQVGRPNLGRDAVAAWSNANMRDCRHAPLAAASASCPEWTHGRSVHHTGSARRWRRAATHDCTE